MELLKITVHNGFEVMLAGIKLQYDTNIIVVNNYSIPKRLLILSGFPVVFLEVIF